RHTRSYGDWSSDVCSSDLHLVRMLGTLLRDARKSGADLHALDGVDAHHRCGDVGVELAVNRLAPPDGHAVGDDGDSRATRIARRSEERRVGKEGRMELSGG